MQRTLSFIKKLENTFDEVDRKTLKEEYQKYYLSLNNKQQEEANKILDEYRDNNFGKVESTLKEAKKLMQEIKKENVNA